MQDKYLTVTALTRYLKYKRESDDNLKHIHPVIFFFLLKMKKVLLNLLCLIIRQKN